MNKDQSFLEEYMAVKFTPALKASSLFALLAIACLIAGVLTSGFRTPEPVLPNTANTAQPLRVTDANPKQKASESYGRLALSFEQNRGQADESINFVARGAGYQLALTSTGAVFQLRKGDCGTRGEEKRARTEKATSDHAALRNPLSEISLTSPSASCNRKSAVLRMNLVGANAAAAVAGQNELEGKVNYFIGNDPAKWHTDVPTFGSVRYTEVYPGVDVVYYGNQRRLEYDFVVAPGRDARAIALEFAGAQKVEVDAASGDLLVRVGEETIRQHAPITYQETKTGWREVESWYALRDGGQVGFEIGEYDRTAPLVIDPVLEYSTYLGGSGDDGTYRFLGINGSSGIAVDSAGNAYVIGTTDSANFPTANPIQGTLNPGDGQFHSDRDVFVTKINAAGTALVYSTYLGGNSRDFGRDIAVDSAGNAYVTGFANSTNFPTANAIQNTNAAADTFVTKLNAAGSALVYSTYLGGNGEEEGNSIALDSAGNAYVTGYTSSTNFPTANAFDSSHNGGLDAFVTKINVAGTALVYSTYLGGSGAVFATIPLNISNDIAVDSVGNAYVTGYTDSTNFPTANAIQNTHGGNPASPYDAFVTKFNAAGSALVYSTYLGGNASDRGEGIAIDSAGNAYLTGHTFSANFPTANAIQNTGGGDAFVTKINAAGSAFVYSTFLGGSDSEFGRDIAVDPAGNAYVTGYTHSSDFPTVNPIQVLSGGALDIFVTKINPAGSAYVYSTYLGGSGDDLVNRIALDSAGGAYITGETRSTCFPTTTGAFDTTYNGGDSDSFISKISETAPPSTLTTCPAPAPSPTPTPTPTPSPSPSPSPTPATVQFIASSVQVQEDCTTLGVTVTRLGDTSVATSVRYSSADVTALQRTDYTLALGTLNFAPTETQKTINLLISEDSFTEGTENFTVSLSNATGGNLGTPATITIQILDDLSEPATNAIDDPATFVCQQYHDLLYRQSEAGGLQFYLNILAGCQSGDTECIKYTRGAVVANFFRSPEMTEKGLFVSYLYMVTLGHRPASQAELASQGQTPFERPHYLEFMADLQSISDPNDDKAAVSAKKDTLTSQFLQRAEIQQIYGALSNSGFVSKLEEVAGVSLANRNQLIADLDSSTRTRAQVLRMVAESAEVRAKFYMQAFITMEYFGLLRRDPDLPGYVFHNDRFRLVADPDLLQNFMVRGFIESPEYRSRFGP